MRARYEFGGKGPYVYEAKRYGWHWISGESGAADAVPMQCRWERE
jgi:hypothetical protein